MVLNISGFFKDITSDVKKHRPLLNAIPTNMTGSASGQFMSSVQTKKILFWKWLRDRPELYAPVAIRVDDTITEVEYYKPDGSPLGPTQLKKAKRLWSDNFVTERLKSVQYDRLVTGDGYIWMGKLSAPENKERTLTEMRTICQRMVKKEIGDINTRDMDVISDKILLRAIDEDLRLPRKIDYVASSTMIINHNYQEVLNYTQNIGGKTIEFSTEEIIHIPLHRVDGKVNGFTPVESLYREMYLIWCIKENMISYMKNGGGPKKLFNFEDEIANSENVEALELQLMNAGQLQNRHGNLVINGKLNVQDLEDKIKDMDYKELALYMTSLIAYALRVPVSRIPFLIGMSSSKGDASGMAESGYWRMISSDQRVIEEHFNTQIANPLGFMIKFSNPNKVDELKDAQTKQMNMDLITKIVAELRNAKVRVKKEKLLGLLTGSEKANISSEDIEEIPEEDLMSDMEKTGMLNKSLVKNNELEPQAKQNKNETKRKAAKNNPSGSDQSGV